MGFPEYSVLMKVDRARRFLSCRKRTLPIECVFELQAARFARRPSAEDRNDMKGNQAIENKDAA